MVHDIAFISFGSCFTYIYFKSSERQEFYTTFCLLLYERENASRRLQRGLFNIAAECIRLWWLLFNLEYNNVFVVSLRNWKIYVHVGDCLIFGYKSFIAQPFTTSDFYSFLFNLSSNFCSFEPFYDLTGYVSWSLLYPIIMW